MNCKRAFTFAELLVVLAILGIVAALLLPVLAGARRSAKSSSCLGNLRQVCFASLRYAADNDDEFPFTILGGNEWLKRIGLTTTVVLFPDKPKLTVNRPTITCPELGLPRDRPGWEYSGYVFNACFQEKTPANPSRTVMLGEFAYFHPIGRPEELIMSDWLDMPDSYWSDRSPWVVDTMGSKYAPYGEWGARRHSGRGNYAFYDGSAKRYPPEAFRVPASGSPCGKGESWLGPQNGPGFSAAATN